MKISEIKQEAKLILRERKKELLNAAACIIWFSALTSLIQENDDISKWAILAVGILVIILERGFQFSLTKMHIKRKNEEEIRVSDVFIDGFKELKKAWSITLGLIPKYIVPIICSVFIVLISLFLTYSLQDVFIENNQLIQGEISILTNSYIRTFNLPIDSLLENLGLTELICIIAGIALYVYTLVEAILLTYKYRYADMEAIQNPEMPIRDVINKTGEIMTGNRKKSFLLDLSFIPSIVIVLFLVYLLFGVILGLLLFFAVNRNFLGILIGFGVILIVLVDVVARFQIKILMSHVVFYDDIKDEQEQEYLN